MVGETPAMAPGRAVDELNGTKSTIEAHSVYQILWLRSAPVGPYLLF